MVTYDQFILLPDSAHFTKKYLKFQLLRVLCVAENRKHSLLDLFFFCFNNINKIKWELIGKAYWPLTQFVIRC